MQQSPRLFAIPDLKPRENGADPTDGAESGDLKNWTQFGDRAQSGEGACCNCCVLNLVSTCCVFFSSQSHCCCHDVSCGNDCAQNFSVEEIRVFQACLVENPSVQVVCFENRAEWRFCLASLCVSRSVGALAPCRRSCARLAQWRPSVLSLPLVFSLCTCALLLNVHLDSCDRTRAISFKQVISTAPPSTQRLPGTSQFHFLELIEGLLLDPTRERFLSVIYGRLSSTGVWTSKKSGCCRWFLKAPSPPVLLDPLRPPHWNHRRFLASLDVFFRAGHSVACAIRS